MVLAVQLTGYLVVTCLSMVVLITMLLNMYDFSFHCLLFTSGDYDEDGNFGAHWASANYCRYVVSVAAIVAVAGFSLSYKTAVRLRSEQDTSFSAEFGNLVLCVCFTLASLVAALFVTLGYEEWCHNITKRFATCSDATRNPTSLIDHLNTSNFYLEIGMAQFGCWAMWSVLVGLCVCAVVRVCQLHHEENISSSMARERERQRFIRTGRPLSSRYAPVD